MANFSVGRIDDTVEAFSDWASIVTAVTLLCAGFILKWAWFSDTPPDVIYYPPLDQELRDKEREARGLCYRVGDGVTPVALSHHRTCGSAYGGS